MDLKVAFVIVCLCALAITSTEAGIPKCCITTKSNIPRELLRNVYKWHWQNNTGACDINALILYVKSKQKPICAHPKVMKLWKRRNDVRKVKVDPAWSYVE